MKRRILTIAITACMSILLGLVGGSAAHALNAQSGETVQLRSSETADSSFFAAGSNVIVDGTVRGDLFCAGQTITITGTVEGDVLCAGQDLRIEGIVKGDVRAAGQNLTIGGSVQGAVTAAGESVVIAKNGSIQRDLTAFGSRVTIDGVIKRDVLVSGETITLTGKVGRNADFEAREVTLTGSAAVGSNLAYTSPEKAAILSGASIAGETRHTVAERQSQTPDMFETYVITPFYWLVALLLIGALGIVAMSHGFKKSTLVLQQRPLLTLGVGLAALVGTPIVAFLIMFTVIGLPLGLLLLLLWVIAMPLGFIGASLCLGTALTKRMARADKWGMVLALLLGLVILIVISLLPWIGGIATFIAIAWGVGGMLLAPLAKEKTSTKKPRVSKTAKEKTT